MYGVLLPQGDQESPTLSSHNGHPSPMSLAPPPQGEFASRDELMTYLKEWGKTQGYAVVIGRSRPNRLWIKCDRGGEYADKHLNDPENRKRKRKATRLTGCMFAVKASMKKDQIWRMHTENPLHNHPPSEDLSVHPSIRRMTDDQLAKVNEMTEAGKTPVETLDELKRIWPDIQVLKRDIYNARKKYKTEKELAEAEDVGVGEYEDPNGKFAGPTPQGRWAWLEDGDEVRKKKKRAKSSSAAANSPTTGFDIHDSESPQIANIGLPSQPLRRATTNLPTTNLATMPSQYHHGGISPQPPPQQNQLPDRDFASAMNYATQSPRQFRHYQTPNSQSIPHRNYTSTPLNTNTDPMLQSTLPPRGRQQPQPDLSAITPVMTPMMQAATTIASSTLPTQATAKPAQSGGGQILMSRIERMEKEQNEQKNMLAQILSAVQGVGGTMRR